MAIEKKEGACLAGGSCGRVNKRGGEGGREGGGSGVGGCGSNMIIGQEGSVAVCRRAGGRGIILGVGDGGWVTEGWDGPRRGGGGLSVFPLNGWSACGSVGVCGRALVEEAIAMCLVQKFGENREKIK